MTITINFPIFPMRREIDARKRRLARNLTSASSADAVNAARPDARYSRDGLEFDVAGLDRLPEGSPSPR